VERGVEDADAVGVVDEARDVLGPPPRLLLLRRRPDGAGERAEAQRRAPGLALTAAAERPCAKRGAALVGVGLVGGSGWSHRSESSSACMETSAVSEWWRGSGGRRREISPPGLDVSEWREGDLAARSPSPRGQGAAGAMGGGGGGQRERRGRRRESERRRGGLVCGSWEE